ncbi:hypothetical protein RhiirC2_842903 [Rhizophagus irregularis]|uniref:Uncharacterized protein n=1 Tax=Rhizophagus irregularis TaxID=588596 RepID=A0A2N1NYW7_9GLOM|nr:hypothetical protein RhiirC2_842903 [Rhizophagus irregularis]
MSIIANKVPGVYASPCQVDRTVFDSRGINNSNVLTLGTLSGGDERCKWYLLRQERNASDSNDDNIEDSDFQRGLWNYKIYLDLDKRVFL